MAQAKGILGTKLGMTQIFTEDARVVPVTVIQAGPCTVTQVKTTERDGYEAVQLAFAEAKRGKTTKPLQGHYAAAGVFFFSSRRRHTRLVSDWSSDVCSSDLSGAPPLVTQN